MWNGIVTAIRLGLIEIRRGLPFTGGHQFIGRRDFLWLTLLLGLTLALAMLLLAARQGVLDKLLDVSLATVPGHGVPIWVSGKSRNYGDALSTRQLDRIGALDEGLRVYPYYDVLNSDISLPGGSGGEGEQSIWRPLPQDAQGVDDEFVSDPLVWAVYADDPLWTTALPNGTQKGEHNITPVVVLNRQAFGRLNCNVYQRAITLVSPGAMFSDGIDMSTDQALKSDKTPDCLRDGHIWLRLRPGENNELHRFRIIWVDRLPTFDEVAILFPMSFYQVLKIAQIDGNLHFFPELLGKPGLRLASIEVHPGQQHHYSKKEFEKFYDCIGREGGKNQATIRFSRPVPEATIEACATNTGLRFQHEPVVGDQRPFLTLGKVIRGSPFDFVSEGKYVCLSPTEQTKGERGVDLCDVDSGLVAVDPVKGSDFEYAIVYVKDRDRVFEVMNHLEGLTTADDELSGRAEVSDEAGESILFIPAPYKDAVRRFGFMTAVLDLFTWPFGLLLSLTLLILSLAQVGMVIQHRRHSYGVYLAKGMGGIAILLMLIVQVSISLGIGFLGACLCLVLTSEWLAVALRRLLAEPAFAGKFMVADLALLPFDWGIVLTVGAVGFVFIWLVTIGLMSRIAFGKHTEPAALLYD